MYDTMIVLEITESYALAMQAGGAIVRIRRKPGLAVGDRIYVLPEDLYQKERAGKVLATAPLRPSNEQPRRRGVPPSALMRATGIAAMFIICLSLFLVSQMTPTAYALASFDGDASIQVSLDRNHHIIRAVSPDGSVPPEELEALAGKPLDEAGPALSRLCGDGSVLIGYAFEKEDLDSSSLVETLRGLFPAQPVVCLPGSAADIQAAAEQNLSLGKYIADKALTQAPSDDLPDDLDLAALEQMLRSDPKWMEVPAFQEALEEERESLQEEETDHSPSTPDQDDDEDGAETAGLSPSSAGPGDDEDEDDLPLVTPKAQTQDEDDAGSDEEESGTDEDGDAPGDRDAPEDEDTSESEDVPEQEDAPDPEEDSEE